MITDSGFKIPDEAVDDLALLWDVGGEHTALDSEEKFHAALDAVRIPGVHWKFSTREDFKKLKKWQQEQVIEELAKPAVVVYSFPHKEVRPVEDLETIDWASCVGAQRSDAGSEGVIFVEFPDKQAVCVKAPDKIAAEMFGTMLCQKLSIRCPKMRMVKRDDPEGQLILQSLTDKNEACVGMLRPRPFYLVIEYVSGFELADKITPVSNPWAREVFGIDPFDPDDLDKDCGTLSTHGKKVLRDLGSLIAFDMMINNHDRLPCIWDNLGNPGNVMFTREDNEVMSIDNMVFCFYPSTKQVLKVGDTVEVLASFISVSEAKIECATRGQILGFEEEGAARIAKIEFTRLGIESVATGDFEKLKKIQGKDIFLDRVKKTCTSLAEDLKETHPHFARVRRMLRNGCIGPSGEGHGWPGLGVDIGDQGTLEVQTGFFNAMECAVYGVSGRSEGPVTLELLQEMEAKLQFEMVDHVAVEGANINMHGLEFIHPTFCFEVVEVFREALKVPEEVKKEATESPKMAAQRSLKRKCTMEGFDFLKVKEQLAKALPNTTFKRPSRPSVSAPVATSVPSTPAHTLRKDQNFVFMVGDEEFSVVNEEHIKDMAQSFKEKKALISSNIRFKQDNANKRLMCPTISSEMVVVQPKRAPDDKYYSIDDLACPPPWPPGVEAAQRENWLSPEEFKLVFGMAKAEFYKEPLWRRRWLKRDKGLF